MRIEFDDGSWVELRETLRFGDIRYANAKGANELDQSAALMERMISTWSYDRPIDEKGIDELSIMVANRIGEVLTEMSTALTKEQSRPLGNGSTSSSKPSTNTVKEQEPAGLTH